MNAEFSEFTYGFALTHELISSRFVSVAPIFPSLIEEGQQGGGYDVKIELSGYPLFLQFKLSEYMIHRSAKEWGIFESPYFRFTIPSSSQSNQHNLLLELEQGNRQVFYVAPEFYTITEINNKFSDGAITSDSVFVRPSSIGSILDNKIHRVVFEPESSIGFFCSKPKEIDIIKGADFINADDLNKKNKLKTKEDFINLGKELQKIASDILGEEWDSYKEVYLMNLLDKPERSISFLSRILFNCEFVILKDNTNKL